MLRSETPLRRVATPKAASAPSPALLPAFTLIELLVVVSIIVLLVAIAAPSVGPALVSNQRTQMVATLNSALVTAQTAAITNSTNVGMRIERAFETDQYGQMVKDGNQPRWLDHQIARMVIYGARRRDASGIPIEQLAFRQVADSKVIALPSGVWLAPDYGLSLNPVATVQPPQGNLAQPLLGWYKPFETFYIIFSPSGTVTRFSQSNLYYLDETQRDINGVYPFVQHSDNSAMGFIVYDRQRLESFGSDWTSMLNYLQRDGQALYLNRFLGSTVGGALQ